MARPRTLPTVPASAQGGPPKSAGSGAAPSGGPGAPTWRDHLRYRFDDLMSRGTPALIGLLGLASVILIVLFSAVVLIGGFAPEVDGHKPGLLKQLLLSLEHGIDTGTVAGDTGQWPFLVLMLLLTLAGLFVITALIGVIATGLDSKIRDLRKGRSLVIESGHVLILGWSETIYTILSELAEANESQRDAAVVILAERDKVEMEDEIREKVGDTSPMRVVCRSGSPIDLLDLERVSPQTSRSVIVLSPGGEDPDSYVIKAILAITRGPNRREEAYHVVAEIHDPSNLEAAALVGGDEAVLIDKREMVARLIVQTSRQSGASVVYTELLDFAGDEIYMAADQRLVGTTYSDALLAYEDASVVGLVRAGQAKLNPPLDTTIGESDMVIAIAEDDDRLNNAAPCVTEPDESVRCDAPIAAEAPSRVLLLGWNLRSPLAIRELDEYVSPGSVITVVADQPDVAEQIAAIDGLSSLQVEARYGNTSDRATLEELVARGYEHVIVMCYAEALDPQRADARTLVTLLHLRDIADRTGETFSIVSEMLDDRNRELAQVTKVDDVIVSDKVLSLMLSQIAENHQLRDVFGELFTAEGSELYLRPVSDYISSNGDAVSYATLVAAARERGESAIGYRTAAQANDSKRGYGVRVNPPKSESFTPAAGDKLCVIAER